MGAQAAETLAREPEWSEAWTAFAFALEIAGRDVHSLTAFRPFPLAAHPAFWECLPQRESPQAQMGLGKAKPELFTLGVITVNNIGLFLLWMQVIEMEMKTCALDD